MKNKIFTVAIFFIVLICYPFIISAEDSAGGEYFHQEGIASWYGTEFDGRPTASGELFDSSLFTAAHPSLPFGTLLNVINQHNNKLVVVRVNDRGPFVSARIIDISMAAARELDMITTGTAPVMIQSIEKLIPRSPSDKPIIQMPDIAQPVEPKSPAPPIVHAEKQPLQAVTPSPEPAPAADHAPVTAHVTPQPRDKSPEETVPAPETAQTTPQPESQPHEHEQAAPAVAPVTVTLQPAPAIPPPAPAQAVAVQPASPPPAAAPAPAAAQPASPPPAAVPAPAAPAATPQRRPAQAAYSSPATLIPNITPVSGKKYKLQVGAYRLSQNAYATHEKLKNAGLNPAYEQYGDITRVILPGISGNEVNSILRILGSAGFNEALIREER